MCIDLLHRPEFPKLSGPWTPICLCFFHSSNKPKTRCSLKKSSLPISLRFCNFRPVNKIFPKKSFHFGPVSDFMVCITFQVCMFDKFCYVVAGFLCNHHGPSWVRGSQFEKLWHRLRHICFKSQSSRFQLAYFIKILKTAFSSCVCLVY